MSLFDISKLIKKNNEEEQYDFHIVGCEHYIDNIEKVMLENPIYKRSIKQITDSYYIGKKIYQYYPLYTEAKLICEPKNEHDKNAIYLQINHKKIGYISREENIYVKDLMNKKNKVTARIYGGKYKIFYESDEYPIEDKDMYGCSIIIEIL